MLQVGLRLWLRICWAGAGVDKMLLLAYSLRVPSLHSRILPREHSASPFLDHHEDLWSTNLTSYHCRSPPPSLDNQHLIPRSFFIQVRCHGLLHNYTLPSCSANKLFYLFRSIQKIRDSLRSNREQYTLTHLQVFARAKLTVLTLSSFNDTWPFRTSYSNPGSILDTLERNMPSRG